MNDLTTIHSRAPARQTEAKKVAAWLRHIRAEMLAVFEEADRLELAHPGWWKIIVMLRHERFPAKPRREAYRQEALCILNSRAASLPPIDAITAVQRTAATLADQPHDRVKTHSLVGLLLDSFPNARPHAPVISMEALCAEIEVDGVPPAAVAKGLNNILRTATFLPTTAEALKACQEARARLRWLSSAYQEALSMQEKIADAVAVLEVRGPITPEEERAYQEEEEEVWRRRSEAAKEVLSMCRRRRPRGSGVAEEDDEIPF